MGKPNYYAIIPAHVRYDEELSSSQKLFYGEITALANKHGYCFANNSYFAKIYGVTSRTIRRWLEGLKKKGYVDVEIATDDEKNFIERKIIIRVRTKMSEGADENVENPADGNVTTPTDENVHNNNINKDNNTRKDNNKYLDVFNFYKTFKNLVNHRKYRNIYRDAMKRAERQLDLTIEDMKMIIERHSKVVESTANDENSVKARGLDVLFGQKKYDATSLICRDYLDDGDYYIRFIKNADEPNEDLDNDSFANPYLDMPEAYEE